MIHSLENLSSEAFSTQIDHLDLFFIGIKILPEITQL